MICIEMFQNLFVQSVSPSSPPLSPVFHISHIDVASAVSTRVPDLMGQNWTLGLLTKVYQEIIIKLHPTILSINIDHEHHGALVAHLRVELLVPGGEQGGGHVQPLPIQAELQHLRSSLYLLTLGKSYTWLHRQFFVFCNLYRSTLLDRTSEENLPCELWIPSIRNIILPDVSMKPVREVEILVIHADDDVSHDPWHLGQDPPLHLLAGHIDHLLRGPVPGLCLIESEHVGKQGRPNEPFGGLRVMQEPDLQRHDPLHPQVNLLQQLLLLPVVNIEVCPV